MKRWTGGGRAASLLGALHFAAPRAWLVYPAKGTRPKPGALPRAGYIFPCREDGVVATRLLKPAERLAYRACRVGAVAVGEPYLVRLAGGLR